MSIYDQRDKPAYRYFKVEPGYAENKHIISWWTSIHDNLISEQIAEYHWMWHCQITEAIVANTERAVLDKWKEEDPLCSRYSWHNLLMNFSIARANILGLSKNIRKPKLKKCLLCDNNFIESSLPFPLVKRLGIEHLDYCAPCLRNTIFQDSGNPKLSKRKTKIYLQDLANVLERVPTQSYCEGLTDFHGMDDKQRLSVLRILQGKPTTTRVKKLFGSWLNALIEAGILEDGTRRTARGIQAIAQDGHVCFSLGEKTIDDFLFHRGIPHEKEPHYPEGNYRGDFLVNETFIEYFGLMGNPEYDEKTKLKRRICKRHNIQLIEIYPTDLLSTAKLERKLDAILNAKF